MAVLAHVTAKRRAMLRRLLTCAVWGVVVGLMIGLGLVSLLR